MPTCILFDLDDTLVDRKESLIRYSVVLASSFRSYLPKGEEVNLPSLLIACDGGGYRPRPEFYAAMQEGIEWLRTPTVNELEKHWLEHFPGLAVPSFGVYRVLHELRCRGYKLGLITNGRSRNQNGKLDALGIRSWFDLVCVSEEVGIHKPDTRIFQQALALLQSTAAEAWYVGDHPVNDIAGARAAEMTAVWMRHGRIWSSDAQPDHEIDSLSDLLPLLPY